jgi:hypothetical protein
MEQVITTGLDLIKYYLLNITPSYSTSNHKSL